MDAGSLRLGFCFPKAEFPKSLFLGQGAQGGGGACSSQKLLTEAIPRAGGLHGTAREAGAGAGAPEPASEGPVGQNGEDPCEARDGLGTRGHGPSPGDPGDPGSLSKSYAHEGRVTAQIKFLPAQREGPRGWVSLVPILANSSPHMRVVGELSSPRSTLQRGGCHRAAARGSCVAARPFEGASPPPPAPPHAFLLLGLSSGPPESFNTSVLLLLAAPREAP